MEPRWRRTEEKVITSEFSWTSRLDETINAQQGFATPSSASLAVVVRAGRNPYYSSVFASSLSTFQISSPSSRNLILSLIFTVSSANRNFNNLLIIYNRCREDLILMNYMVESRINWYKSDIRGFIYLLRITCALHNL